MVERDGEVMSKERYECEHDGGGRVGRRGERAPDGSGGGHARFLMTNTTTQASSMERCPKMGRETQEGPRKDWEGRDNPLGLSYDPLTPSVFSLHRWRKSEVMCSATYPFWPIRVTRRFSPYLFLIHFMPCSCGSTTSGQRSQVTTMVAFSTDMRSAGRPWFCQAATSASSVSILRGSRVGVTGTGT